jgi:hypothetical protein
MNKKNKTYKDYLSSLLSFLDAKEETPSYDVDQALTNAGYKPDDVGKKFQVVADKSMARSPHNWRNRARTAHEDAKAGLSKKDTIERPRRSRSEILDAIHVLLSQQNLKVAFAHRNFSDQTDEDLENLLDQLEYIASQKSKDSDE